MHRRYRQTIVFAVDVKHFHDIELLHAPWPTGR